MLKTIEFESKIKSIELTDLGLTNKNYIMTLQNDEKYFVRIPYKHNYALFNYELEEQIYRQIKPLKINLEYISLDPQTGVKISPYLEGIKHLDELDLREAAVQVAKDLQKLHSTEIVNHEFDVKSKYFQFKELNSLQIYPLEDYEYLLQKLAKYPQRVLCHNDLVNGNVVSYQNKVYLIDYEYSSDNHPYFDLLSFITENSINDEEVRKLFFETYLNRTLTSKDKDDLLFFELIHDLLWCQWAQMQASLIDDPIYLEIAQTKYQQLIKNRL
jgi:thiamine kinase-like enzyme